MFGNVVEVIDSYNSRENVYHLDEEGILQEEQKGYRKKSRRTCDHLFIDGNHERGKAKEDTFSNGLGRL